VQFAVSTLSRTLTLTYSLSHTHWAGLGYVRVRVCVWCVHQGQYAKIAAVKPNGMFREMPPDGHTAKADSLPVSGAAPDADDALPEGGGPGTGAADREQSLNELLASYAAVRSQTISHHPHVRTIKRKKKKERAGFGQTGSVESNEKRNGSGSL
jgi:hypothetical protein